MEMYLVNDYQKVNRGFTLVELLIVVAIIAIMAAIAIPSYQDYLVRAKVTEGISQAAAAKTLVSENSSSGNSDLSSGFISPANGDIVDSVSVNSTNGQITVTFNANLSGSADTIIFTPTDGGNALAAGTSPTNSIDWSCTSGTLASRYRPPNCRP